LTEGRPRLRDWTALNDANVGPPGAPSEATTAHGHPTLQALVLGAEAGSTHPLAAAFAQAWPGVTPARPDTVRHALGGGVVATYPRGELVVGSPAFVAKHMPVGAAALRSAEHAAAAGATPVLVAWCGRPCALASFGDSLRADACAAVQRIRKLGHRVAILSGDHPAAVARAAVELGAPLEFALGGVTPEDKLTRIQREATRGPVIMIGDGVNDAAALSAATVGIAVHGGAEASLLAADVYLTEPGVAIVEQTLAGARRTLQGIRRSVKLSLVYNLVGVSLAMAGLIGPLLAAVLMPLSSATVVANAYRSRTFGVEL
jgi:Cu2+-exporting ATPase